MVGTQRFADKVVFVTGAAGGIGRATAIAFAREGAGVAILDRTEAALANTAHTIADAGGEVLVLGGDVSSPDQVEAAIGRVVEKFGRLDIAFNNAGVENKFGSVAEIDLDEWDRVLNINLRGVFICVKHEAAQMLRQGGGVIVNTSSVAGMRAAVGLAPYVASKHGVIGLTKTAALDLAKHNIRVNAVLPGVIQTPLIDRIPQETLQKELDKQPVGRAGKPEEIAEAVLWLSSDLSGFVTGAAITIDGGWSA